MSLGGGRTEQISAFLSVFRAVPSVFQERDSTVRADATKVCACGRREEENMIRQAFLMESSASVVCVENKQILWLKEHIFI